jgi:hypothetical protein
MDPPRAYALHAAVRSESRYGFIRVQRLSSRQIFRELPCAITNRTAINRGTCYRPIKKLDAWPTEAPLVPLHIELIGQIIGRDKPRIAPSLFPRQIVQPGMRTGQVCKEPFRVSPLLHHSCEEQTKTAEACDVNNNITCS